MARLISGVNGPFIGKAGAVIGYVVNGVGYIKGLYKSRTKPPTEMEAFNHRKFAVAQAWLKPLKQHVRAGFKGYDPKFQGFVAAKSWLLKNALKVIDGQITIDPSLVKTSSGDLHLPENLTCSFTGRELTIEWKSSWDADRDDQLSLAAYDIEGAECFGQVYGNTRLSGKQKFEFRKDDVGKIVHLYAGFIAADRSRQSDSIYMGAFEVTESDD